MEFNASERGGNRNSGESSSTPPTAAANPKQRSCVTCRTRKVRCNKASPCNHCQRAGISCVFPTPDRVPRWARRLTQQPVKDAPSKSPRDPNQAVAPVMDRLHKLENLVKELSSQLHQEQGAAGKIIDPASMAHTAQNTPSPSVDGPGRSTGDIAGTPEGGDLPSATRSVDHQFGRLVVDDYSHTRYVSSGFWSRVNDELDNLRMETGALAGEDLDLSDDGDSPGKSSHDAEQAATERHAFLFGHNIGSPGSSTEDLHPPPSQIPLLLAIFTRNVNALIQVVHMPTVMNMVQNRHETHSHATDALLFAIYYGTIASMEDEDVLSMLGASKSTLSRKYRFGLEHSLAKADFLNVPDVTLVQAFATFLLLLRRDESPRYVWMMTGMVIRMAMGLGLHRDGAKLKHLTPYDIEIRRRVWWVVLCLDLRSSEDQGVDLTVAHGTFDTMMPLNINDLDLDPGSTKQPAEREGLTDMTFALYNINTCQWTRDTFGPNRGLEDTEKRLNDFYVMSNQKFLSLAVDLADMSHWVGYMVLRLVISKMTLILYMPELFSTPVEKLPPDFHTKVFMSALEVAEINHALNAEEKARHWRWMIQTYSQWHAIVILLIEASRRPWSPTVERAWTALQSKYLIPSQSSMAMGQSLRVWVPLRKLIAQARRHRTAEIERLRNDPHAAEMLEREDAEKMVPPRGGRAHEADIANVFRDRWWQLVGTSGARSEEPVIGHGRFEGTPHVTGASLPTSLANEFQPHPSSSYTDQQPREYQPRDFSTLPKFQFQFQSNFESGFGSPPAAETANPFQNQQPSTYLDPSSQAGIDAQTLGGTFDPWLWADSELSVDDLGNIQVESIDLTTDPYNNGVDWMDWFGTAKDVEVGKSSGDGVWGGV